MELEVKCARTDAWKKVTSSQLPLATNCSVHRDTSFPAPGNSYAGYTLVVSERSQRTQQSATTSILETAIKQQPNHVDCRSHTSANSPNTLSSGYLHRPRALPPGTTLTRNCSCPRIGRVQLCIAALAENLLLISAMANVALL